MLVDFVRGNLLGVLCYDLALSPFSKHALIKTSHLPASISHISQIFIVLNSPHSLSWDGMANFNSEEIVLHSLYPVISHFLFREFLMILI